MDEQEKVQARNELLGFRRAVTFNLEAAERRIERIKLDKKPDRWTWQENASIVGYRTCIAEIDKYLGALDGSQA